ncbi:hypothetical protein GCM10010106_37310 [Thermopolyspora flexuosa]|nr:hypothetical protein GCM10010106_37310 [Thermopolyspora flexuosa]
MQDLVPRARTGARPLTHAPVSGGTAAPDGAAEHPPSGSASLVAPVAGRPGGPIGTAVDHPRAGGGGDARRGHAKTPRARALGSRVRTASLRPAAPVQRMTRR